MTTCIRIGLIFALTMLVAVAYSPSALAEKKDHSNSNSDDKKDDDQNDQPKQKSNSQQFQKSNTQQFQNLPKNSQNKQFKFDKSQQSQNNFQNNQQFQNNQKQPPWQNLQKQNSSQQNLQKNIQLQGIQNKPDWISKSHNDHKDVKNFVVKFGGPEPFSNKWYNDHPKAWHYHHDHDDAWKVVTAAGVLGFLGWEVYHPRTVVVYEPLPYDTLFYSRSGVIIDPSRGKLDAVGPVRIDAWAWRQQHADARPRDRQLRPHPRLVLRHGQRRIVQRGRHRRPAVPIRSVVARIKSRH